MEHLPKKIHHNGISYTMVGDYYIPNLKLPEESRPIGRWGRMHKAFLQEYHPGQYNELDHRMQDPIFQKFGCKFYRKGMAVNCFDDLFYKNPALFRFCIKCEY